jgi:hypothetical protein
MENLVQWDLTVKTDAARYTRILIGTSDPAQMGGDRQKQERGVPGSLPCTKQDEMSSHGRDHKWDISTERNPKGSDSTGDLRELYRPSDRRLSTKLVPTFTDTGVSRGQRNGSPLFPPSSSSVVLTRLSGPRSRPTTSQKIWNQTRASGSVARSSDNQTTGATFHTKIAR